MNGKLTILIDSGNYIDADRALRITMAEAAVDPMESNVAAIVHARRLLGFSMSPYHLYSDYRPEESAPKSGY